MATRLFKCSSAEVREYSSGHKYLVLCQSGCVSDWMTQKAPDYIPVSKQFTYTKHTLVASGNTYDELWESAREYKRLADMPESKWGAYYKKLLSWRPS